MKNTLKITSILLIVCAVLLTSCATAEKTDDTVKSEEPFDAVDIYSGNNSENSGKPLTSQRIALKCKSAYGNDEKGKIIIDVAMGDGYSHHQSQGVSPSYDTFDVNGRPVFEVYAGNTVQSDERIDDDLLSINGENKAFVKNYTKDDMEKLDITDEYDDITKYNHEFVELDLSRYEVGSSGTIVFSFGWQYENENPNSSDPLSLWEGQRKVICYYVGEKGVTVSFASCEYAKECYKNNGTPNGEEIQWFNDGKEC